LDYVNFYPVTVDLEQSRVIAIYGKKGFGKTNLLYLLLSGVVQQRPEAEIVFLTTDEINLNLFITASKTK